jgi:hypothetical protein
MKLELIHRPAKGQVSPTPLLFSTACFMEHGAGNKLGRSRTHIRIAPTSLRGG